MVSSDFSQLYNYKKAYRFADDKLKKQLQEYKNKSVYNRASSIMKSTSTADGFMNAKALFDSLDDYSDARAQSLTCHDKALETTYRNAMNVYNNSTSVKDYEKAAEIFEKVGTYSDAVEMISKCDVKTHELKYDEAYKLYKRYEDLTTDKNITFEYCQAAQTDLKKAIELFDGIIDYSDSERISNSCAEKLKIAEYAYASSSLKKAETAVEYKEAGEIFEKLGDYLDAPSMRKKCRDGEFEYNYNKACDILSKQTTNLKNSTGSNADIRKGINVSKLVFEKLENYKDSKSKLIECEHALMDIEYYKLKKLSNNKNYYRKDWENLIKALKALNYGEYRKNDINNLIQKCEKKIASIESHKKLIKRNKRIVGAFPVIGVLGAIALFVIGEIVILPYLSKDYDGLLSILGAILLCYGLPIALIFVLLSFGGLFEEFGNAGIVSIPISFLFIVISFVTYGIYNYSSNLGFFDVLFTLFIGGIDALVGTAIGYFVGCIIREILLGLFKTE